MLIAHCPVAPIKALNEVFAATPKPAIASTRINTFIPDSGAPARGPREAVLEIDRQYPMSGYAIEESAI